MTNVNKYLSTVSFPSLLNWSVQYLLDNDFKYTDKYTLARIGSFLSRNKTPIDIEDGENYKRITIKINNGGVLLRDIEKGENIGTKKQYLVNEGQFVFSRIDARNGAFGIIPKELEGAIVTNDFPVFDINPSVINLKYLVLVTTTKVFIKYAQASSSGTTNRQRINVDTFLSQTIPLPSLEEQRKIVEAYNRKIQLAEQQEEKVSILEKEIECYLLGELGIEKEVQQKRKKGLSFVQFKSLSRWDVWDIENPLKVNKGYEIMSLRDFTIGKPMYGANEKGVKAESKVRYIRITDINEFGTLNDDFVSPANVDKRFLLKENDFLIARSGNTVGKTFLYKEKYGNAIYAGYLVKYILNQDIVYPDYIALYTQSTLFKDWVSKNQRVAAQPNINGQEYLAATFVIPPLSRQKEITNHIINLKGQIKTLLQRAKQSREQAIVEFESTIFD